MKVAILDLYDGTKNLGMDAIQAIVDRYETLQPKVYDVRGKSELPDLSYDFYISSGGPGSPLEGDGVWDRAFYFFLDKLWKHNQRSDEKKHMLFICHSFQMACQYLAIGNVMLRNKPSYGVVMAHLTAHGMKDPVMKDLESEFYVADFRSWQVVHPDYDRISNLGCQVLALEKVREDVPLERALMAVRYSPEWLGVQFHPEAGPEGMKSWFDDPEKIDEIKQKKGQEGFERMKENVLDPDRLRHTYDTVIPNFITAAMEAASQPELV